MFTACHKKQNYENIINIILLMPIYRLANNIRSTFNENMNKKIEDNRNQISQIDVCIQQFKLASECLKIYKSS